MLNEEITPIDQLIEWLQINHDITIPTDLFHELKRDEKIHAQWWYNKGFTKAKSIYWDAEWHTLKAVCKLRVLSGSDCNTANSGNC